MGITCLLLYFSYAYNSILCRLSIMIMKLHSLWELSKLWNASCTAPIP